MGDSRSYPLPEDPALADAASAIRDTGHWGWVVDERWRLMWASDEVRLSFGALVELAPFELGAHLFGPESMRTSEGWRMGSNSVELNRLYFRRVGGLILTDTPGGRDELRELVDPALRDIVDELTPTEGTMLSFTTQGFGLVGASDVPVIAFRLRDVNGRLAGTALISKPAAGMAMLSAMTFTADLGHVARMGLVAEAGRRPAAILFADLEASSPLARRLSTASYFALGRRLVRASDQCVVDAGGLVGRHVGAFSLPDRGAGCRRSSLPRFDSGVVLLDLAAGILKAVQERQEASRRVDGDLPGELEQVPVAGDQR